jgi:pimeloyl-ACP methyl ester carboxylesterase
MNVSHYQSDHRFVMRSGRTLEVWEYGDPAGHPVFFFHGLIGSHYQASHISEQARQEGLRIIAPNRPGVGASEFIERASALDTVTDVEDLAAALSLDEFSLIGISGGTPYALAALYRLAGRVRTVTVISGMGPMHLRGGLHGMDRRRRVILELGARYPQLAQRFFRKAQASFRANAERFLNRLITTWPVPDQQIFQRREVYDLFLRDLHEVLTDGNGPLTLSQDLTLYRNYGFGLADLPADKRIILWHGLADKIVSPWMAWRMAQALPSPEAHFVPGGHFVAVDVASQIITRLRRELDEPGGEKSFPAPAASERGSRA